MTKSKTAVKAAEVSQAAKTETANYTAAEAAKGAEVLAAAQAVDKASGEMFALVMSIPLNGLTFEGVEAATPKLKEFGSWRSAKATVKGALSHGVPLLDNGKTRSKGDLAKALSVKTKTEDDGTSSTNKTERKTRAATPAEVVKSGLAYLNADAKLRQKFMPQILLLAEKLVKEFKKAA